MLQHGPKAAFMKDKHGYLPAHVACFRHCSPKKLRMLLKVNPSSLYAKTNDGETMLDLAKRKATKSHPNVSLIDALQKRMQERKPPPVVDNSRSSSPVFFLDLVGPPDPPVMPALEPEPIWPMYEPRMAAPHYEEPPAKRYKYTPPMEHHHTENPEDLLLNFASTASSLTASVNLARVSIDEEDTSPTVAV